MKKRIVAMFLAVCFIVTLLPTAAFAADDADTLINLLEKEGIKAAVIGRATDNNDKVINNLDEVRYLDTPQRDEIYRFL